MPQAQRPKQPSVSQPQGKVTWTWHHLKPYILRVEHLTTRPRPMLQPKKVLVLAWKTEVHLSKSQFVVLIIAGGSNFVLSRARDDLTELDSGCLNVRKC